MFSLSMNSAISLVFLATTAVQGFVINHRTIKNNSNSKYYYESDNNCSADIVHHQRLFQSLLQAKNANNEPSQNTKSKNKQQKKKRRFAQDVKPIVSIPTNMSPKKFSKGHQPMINESNSEKSHRRPNMNSKNKRSIMNGPKNSDILQSTKSIEELEGIMSNRWGTRLEKWTADFDEWEVVYDDDDANDNKNSKNTNPFYVENKSVKSGRKMKAKPVLNPWDKEERQNKYNQQQQESTNDSLSDGNYADNSSSLFQSAKTRQDAVLDRVRKNQERLRQQKNKRKEGQEERQPQQQRKSKERSENRLFELEFYDEDDEGYEGTSSTSYHIYNDEEDEGLENEAMDFYDNIISPNPVGGPGSSQSYLSSKNEKEESGGFFFNQAVANESDNEFRDTNESLTSKVAKKIQKEKKSLGKPMLDKNGKEQYLTLDQAKRLSKLNNVHSNDGEGDSFANDQLSWDDIGITNSILRDNLNSMNCMQPLSVQDKACPSIVTGNDVLISTHTGSGKTLAFLAPLAQRLLFDADQSQGVKVIIVAPGRELASQIVAVARELFQGTELTAMLAIGGTPFSRNYEQIRKKKPVFLIGTPGRIAELVVGKPGDKSGKLKIANLQTIVLDECDALLEYEPHREPTEAMMNVLKRRHRDSLQSILCSATAGDLLKSSKLDGYLRETYVHARSDDNDMSITAPSEDEGFSRTRVSRTAIHGVVRVEHQRFALDMLRKILYTEPSPQQVLIFVDNARRVGIVVDKLAEMDIIAAALHGGQGSEKGDRAEVREL